MVLVVVVAVVVGVGGALVGRKLLVQSEAISYTSSYYGYTLCVPGEVHVPPKRLFPSPYILCSKCKNIIYFCIYMYNISFLNLHVSMTIELTTV